MSVQRPDIVIVSSKGDPIALIDIKRWRKMSSNLAVKFRRRLKTNTENRLPYYLLLSQDTGFLWKDPQLVGISAPPTYEFSMDHVVARYSSSKPGKRLYEADLISLVLKWLIDLSKETQQAMEEPERTLALAGFNESIKGAQIAAVGMLFTKKVQIPSVIFGILTFFINSSIYSAEYLILFILYSAVITLLLLYVMNGFRLVFSVIGLIVGAIATLFILVHYNYFMQNILLLDHKIVVIYGPIFLTVFFLLSILIESFRYFREQTMTA